MPELRQPPQPPPHWYVPTEDVPFRPRYVVLFGFPPPELRRPPQQLPHWYVPTWDVPFRPRYVPLGFPPTWFLPTHTMEMEFSGVGAGWTDVSIDLTNEPIRFSYGIQSYLPGERTAASGTLMFSLINDASASGGLGYYSPNHANKRAGFSHGIRVRVKQVYKTDTRYFMAKLTRIQVTPGRFEEPGLPVRCICVDWMDEAARTNANTALQLNKRSDETVSAILANISVQPAATSISAGADTYVRALDNVSSDTKALTKFSYMARSELGYIFCKRDATVGQTFVFESRSVRNATSAILASLDNVMHEIGLPSDRNEIFNVFKVMTHPRITTGYAGIVVAKLDDPMGTAIDPGASIEIFIDYTDPAQRDTKIGAFNQITPVATTDYIMNTVRGGGGTDLTASFTVTPTYFASAVKFVLTNNHASLAGFVNTLQLRGDGIASLNPIIAVEKNQASINTYGESIIDLDMIAQDDPEKGRQAAKQLVDLFSNPLATVSFVKFVANQSDELMTTAIVGDISSKVQLMETISGLTEQTEYFINGVEFEVEEFERVQVTWWLAPADPGKYWFLGTVGKSELGTTTRLGYL